MKLHSGYSLCFCKIASITIIVGALFCSSLFATQYPLLDATSPQGKISVVFATDSSSLSLEKDMTATLSAVYPANSDLEMPSIDDIRTRFEGFSLAEGYYHDDTPTTDGTATKTIRWRLRGNPAATRYRLAPFAIKYGNDSYVSMPVLFPLASLPITNGDIEITPQKFFVWPTPRAIFKWILRGLAACATIAIVWLLLARIRRAVRIHMMTPSQRALHELDSLLSKNLPGRGLFKDFYIELTFVVRRYIERTYGIRAPRLTTEEFLIKAKSDSRFDTDRVDQLSGFLQSADMVKFAGIAATVEMALSAATLARRYIESDATSSELRTRQCNKRGNIVK